MRWFIIVEEDLKPWSYYEKIFKEYHSKSKLGPPYRLKADEILSDKTDPVGARYLRNQLLFCWNWDYNYIDDMFNISKNSNLKDIDDIADLIDKALEEGFGFYEQILHNSDDIKFNSLKEIFDKMNIDYEE